MADQSPEVATALQQLYEAALAAAQAMAKRDHLNRGKEFLKDSDPWVRRTDMAVGKADAQWRDLLGDLFREAQKEYEQ